MHIVGSFMLGANTVAFSLHKASSYWQEVQTRRGLIRFQQRKRVTGLRFIRRWYDQIHNPFRFLVNTETYATKEAITCI